MGPEPEDLVHSRGCRHQPLGSMAARNRVRRLEHGPEFSVRAPCYYIIESVYDCWSCSNLTRVFSFKLPKQYEAFDYYEDEDEDFALTSNLGEWKCHGYRRTVSNVVSLFSLFTKQIHYITNTFKQAYSKR
jgi:hypothetical protein